MWVCVYTISSSSCVCLSFYSVPLVFFKLHLATAYYLTCYHFIISLDIWINLTDFFVFQHHVSYSWPFIFHVSFRINLSVSSKKFFRIGLGISLDLQINLRRIDISIILSLLLHDQSMFLYLFRFKNFFPIIF